jgi:hypothetical protein
MAWHNISIGIASAADREDGSWTDAQPNSTEMPGPHTVKERSILGIFLHSPLYSTVVVSMCVSFMLGKVAQTEM